MYSVSGLATLAASSSIDTERDVKHAKLNNIPESGTHAGHWQPTTNETYKEYIEVSEMLLFITDEAKEKVIKSNKFG